MIPPGWIWLFTTIDHWNSECVGYHLAKKGARFAAMESVISGVKKIYRKVEKGGSNRTENADGSWKSIPLGLLPKRAQIRGN